jgi:hypothetical protein
MAIDPSIALSARGPQIESPIDQMAKVLSLRDMMAQGQVRGLQLQQMKQAQQDEAAMRGAMRFGKDGALDRAGTLAELYKVAPQAAEKWRHTWAKEDADLQEAQAKGNKANIEQALKWNEAIASLTRGVKDQGTYTMALNRAKQLGIPGVGDMPAQYDQGFVQNLQVQALTAVDYYNSQRPQSDLARINADEAAGLISPQQAEAMRRKMTTHAPAVQVNTGERLPPGWRVDAADPSRWTPIPGGPHDPDRKGAKPLTEQQANALGFGIRARDAHSILSNLERSGVDSSGINYAVSDKLPFGGGYALSKDQQLYKQAQTDFVTAVLRKESGAAIHASEFDTEARKYFPQPGDSPETIRQKNAARQRAIQVLEIQAGKDLPTDPKPTDKVERTPGAPYAGQSATQADLEHTAQKNGMTVQEVKRRWIAGGGRVVK